MTGHPSQPLTSHLKILVLYSSMNKHIILFGAGKSASVLITYLLEHCAVYNWRLTVADIDINLAQSKTSQSLYAEVKQMQVEDAEQRAALVKEGDLVISMLPPALHFLVASDCLLYSKNLLTASYLDEKIKSLAPAIKNKGLLFLCEMGLDPGIDHMSAMRLIDRVELLGGEISSFKSHCGGLTAPESDDNPWHYKISWNPANIVRAGASGARFMEDRLVKEIDYKQLFNNCKSVTVEGIDHLVYYPNRNSLPYMALYNLQNAATFMRTTLRHTDYCKAWNCLINAGLTDDSSPANYTGLTFKKWSAALTPYINSITKIQFGYLGLFDEQVIPGHLKTSAAILQFLLENKLMMQPTDNDMIVMLHEVEYYREEVLYKTNSRLILKGAGNINTAMAKTVGLPLGIAAGLILKNELLLTGLHIPVIPEIYNPVLDELHNEGITFIECDSVVK